MDVVLALRFEHVSGMLNVQENLLEHSRRLLGLGLVYIVMYTVIIVVVYCISWENVCFDLHFFFNVMLMSCII